MTWCQSTVVGANSAVHCMCVFPYPSVGQSCRIKPPSVSRSEPVLIADEKTVNKIALKGPKLSDITCPHPDAQDRHIPAPPLIRSSHTPIHLPFRVIHILLIIIPIGIRVRARFRPTIPRPAFPFRRLALPPTTEHRVVLAHVVPSSRTVETLRSSAIASGCELCAASRASNDVMIRVTVSQGNMGIRRRTGAFALDTCSKQ